MSNQILKPKHLMTYVPVPTKDPKPGQPKWSGEVVHKNDFTEKHLENCKAYVKEHGLDVDEYLKSRFEVASFKDMPLFVENGEPKQKSKGKKKESEEEELQRLIAEEEKAKEKAPE